MSLQWDSETGEPYLSIASHPGFRITPARDTPEEEEAMVSLYDSEPVGKTALRRPWPYNRDDAREFIDFLASPQKLAAEALRAKAFKPESPVSELKPPFNVIRDPTGRMMGDVGVFDFHKQDPEATEKSWMLSYHLHPNLHGSRLGRAAVTTMLEWVEKNLAPCMLFAIIQTNNLGSQKLITACGFEQKTVYMQEWPDYNGGGEREVARWERKFA